MCAHWEQQNSQLANVNQLPGNLLTRLCNLDTTDAKTLQLYEKVESAAVKYRKQDLKAKRYVRGVQRFADNIIMAFEGLQRGTYTQDEVFEDFKEDVEHNQQHLMMPLEEVTSALADAAGDVFSLITESGILVGEYQLAGRRFEALRDVTAIVSNDQGVASVLSSLPNLLGVASSGFSAAMAVFSVMSRAVATWSEIEQRNQRYNKELLIAFNNELSEVARIMQEQQSLLQSAYDIFGLDMTRMESKIAKRLASGHPTKLTVDRIIKEAKELEALCQSFRGNRH